jgi:DNA polymerase-4
MRKPDGQFAIPPWRGEEFIETLPVKEFHGVGPVTAERLNTFGIHTGADLKVQPLAFLEQHFGEAGAWYYAIARGDDDRPVQPNRPRKSSGSETTFSEDRSQSAEIERGIIQMADDVWSWCEKNQSFGSAVTVKIKFADFRIATRSRTHTRPIVTRESLHEISLGLVRTVLPVEIGVRLVGVAVSKFVTDDDAQLVLALGENFNIM